VVVSSNTALNGVEAANVGTALAANTISANVAPDNSKPTRGERM
jgi:hypothetical protein